MSAHIHILFVEDMVTDYDLAIYEIKKARQDFTSECVETPEDYKDALKNFKPDIIISDYVMPRFNGMAALDLKKEICPDIPFIMLTGSTNEETAVECMKAGADDYVIKEHIKRLPHAIAGALTKAAVKREVKLASQEISKRELLLRNAVNNLPSTFTIYDAQGRIEYINDYGLMLSNLMQESAMGKKEEEINPPEITQSYLPFLKKTFETKERQITECLINYKDLPRYVVYYFVPTLDENNNIYKVLGIAYDITERKNAEERLLVAMKRVEEYDQIKSTFLSNISHEIRTPLNAIMGFAQMIKKSYEHDEQLVSFTDIIMISGNQLLDIIKEMIEISQLALRKSQTTNTDFSITDLMNELFAYFQSQEEQKIKHGLTLELKMQKIFRNQDVVFSDREKLTQILKNLLNNAFKFTYEGKITLGFKKHSPEYWQFYVRDTGIGIQENKLGLIFDTFRQGDESNTRQFGGVGLGLAICREMVNLLGGKIWVESKPEEGSTFHFIIPARVNQA
jgi:PAS domain S-box-containing protein